MKLIDLSIGPTRREKITYTGSGSGCTVISLYLHCLGKKYDADCRKVVVIITNSSKIYTDRIINLIDYIEIYEHFDFEKFNHLEKYEKKLMILDTLQSALLRTAKEFNLETKPLIDAYNCCIERQLVYHTYKEKGRYYLSPDKKYYARVFYSMNSDKIEVYVIFYNKKKEELNRIKVSEDNPCLYEKGNAGWIKDESLTFRLNHGYKKNIFWDIKLELTK